VVVPSEKYAESEKSGITFLDHVLFQKTHFREKNVLFRLKIALKLSFFSQSEFLTKNSTFFSRKARFLKGYV
jgi:hypothetical protein